MFLIIPIKPLQTNGQGVQTLRCKYSAAQCTSTVHSQRHAPTQRHLLVAAWSKWKCFLLLHIPCVLLSNLSSDLQISVLLFSSSSTVLCIVYAYDLYNLYCFYIVYTVLYNRLFILVSLCALPQSSADFVVTAIKRLQRYFRFILELKMPTPA